jgi:hypothetical protein
LYRPVAGKPHLAVGLLMLLIVVLTACGVEAHARKIPESPGGRSMKSIPAGKYVSDEFRPAMSFRLNEGWQTGPAADFSYGHFMEKYNRLTLSRVSELEPSYLGVPGCTEGLRGRELLRGKGGACARGHGLLVVEQP